MSLEEKVENLEKQVAEFKQITSLARDLEDPISVITPFEGTLSAPLHSATEYTKLYITATRIYNLLAMSTVVHRDENDNIISVSLHPELKTWFKNMKDLLDSNQKITALREAKLMDMQVSVVNKYIDENLSKEEREKITDLLFENMRKDKNMVIENDNK